MARTRVFVAITFVLLIPNAGIAVGSPLHSTPGEAITPPATSVAQGDRLPGGRKADAPNRESDETSIDSDEGTWETRGERLGDQLPSFASVTSVVASNRAGPSGIEPTLVIPIHAPPSNAFAYLRIGAHA